MYYGRQKARTAQNQVSRVSLIQSMLSPSSAVETFIQWKLSAVNSNVTLL